MENSPDDLRQTRERVGDRLENAAIDESLRGAKYAEKLAQLRKTLADSNGKWLGDTEAERAAIPKLVEATFAEIKNGGEKQDFVAFAKIVTDRAGTGVRGKYERPDLAREALQASLRLPDLRGNFPLERQTKRTEDPAVVAEGGIKGIKDFFEGLKRAGIMNELPADLAAMGDGAASPAVQDQLRVYARLKRRYETTTAQTATDILTKVSRIENLIGRQPVEQQRKNWPHMQNTPFPTYEQYLAYKQNPDLAVFRATLTNATSGPQLSQYVADMADVDGKALKDNINGDKFDLAEIRKNLDMIDREALDLYIDISGSKGGATLFGMDVNFSDETAHKAAEYGKVAATIGVAVAATIATGGLAAGVGMGAVAAGATAGAAGGLAGAVGGELIQWNAIEWTGSQLSSMALNAVLGAVSGGVAGKLMQSVIAEGIAQNASKFGKAINAGDIEAMIAKGVQGDDLVRAVAQQCGTTAENIAPVMRQVLTEIGTGTLDLTTGTGAEHLRALAMGEESDVVAALQQGGILSGIAMAVSVKGHVGHIKADPDAAARIAGKLRSTLPKLEGTPAGQTARTILEAIEGKAPNVPRPANDNVNTASHANDNHAGTAEASLPATGTDGAPADAVSRPRPTLVSSNPDAGSGPTAFAGNPADHAPTTVGNAEWATGNGQNPHHAESGGTDASAARDRDGKTSIGDGFGAGRTEGVMEKARGNAALSDEKNIPVMREGRRILISARQQAFENRLNEGLAAGSPRRELTIRQFDGLDAMHGKHAETPIGEHDFGQIKDKLELGKEYGLSPEDRAIAVKEWYAGLPARTGAEGPKKGPLALEKITFPETRTVGDTAASRIELMNSNYFKQIEGAPFGADPAVQRVRGWTADILAKVPPDQRAEAFGKIRKGLDDIAAGWDRDIARMAKGSPERDSAEKVVAQIRKVASDLENKTAERFPEIKTPAKASEAPETAPSAEYKPSHLDEAYRNELLGVKEVGQFVNEFATLSFKAPDERAIDMAMNRRNAALVEAGKIENPRQQRVAIEFFNAHFDRAVRQIIEPNLRDPLQRWGSGGKEQAQALIDLAAKKGVKLDFDANANPPPGARPENIAELSGNLERTRNVVDAKESLERTKETLAKARSRTQEIGTELGKPGAKFGAFRIDTMQAFLGRTRNMLEGTMEDLRNTASRLTDGGHVLSVASKKAIENEAMEEVQKSIAAVNDLIRKAESKRPAPEDPKPTATTREEPKTPAAAAAGEKPALATNEYGVTKWMASKFLEVARTLEKFDSIEGTDLPKNRTPLVTELEKSGVANSTEGKRLVEGLKTVGSGGTVDVPPGLKEAVKQALNKISASA